MSEVTELAVREQGAVEQAPRGSMLQAILQAIREKNYTPGELKELLEFGKELEAISAKEAFNRAAAAMRPRLPAINKNGLIEYKAGSKGAKFAKWDDIHKACMPVLDEFGFVCSFSSDMPSPGALKVTMTVRHRAGHEDTASFILPWLDKGGSKSDGQAAASSYSIGERHCFIKYWNILTVDPKDTGYAEPERITADQAAKIQDILQACEEREPGVTKRFTKWLGAEMKTGNPAELFQGEQLDAVMDFLNKKMAKLGIA